MAEAGSKRTSQMKIMKRIKSRRKIRSKNGGVRGRGIGMAVITGGCASFSVSYVFASANRKPL